MYKKILFLMFGIVAGFVIASNAEATASINVVSPNGGEKWEIGQTYAIKWYSSNVDPVSIHLYKGGEFVKNLNLHDTTNRGVLEWTLYLALVPGDDYKIKILSANNSAITDESDAVFSIVSSTLSKPAPPTNLAANSAVCGKVNLSWTSNESNASFIIERGYLSSGGAVIWKQIGSTMANNATSYFDQTNINGESYYRIKAFKIAVFSDYSNIAEIKNYVSCSTGKFIKITSPNGGEAWIKGKTYAITWESAGIGHISILVQNYADEIGVGTGWEYTGGNSGSFLFTVPENWPSGETFKVSVVDISTNGWNDGVDNDNSDNYFSIVSEAEMVNVSPTLSSTSSLPDIIITDLKIDPPSPVVGQKAVVSFTVKNNGASTILPTRIENKDSSVLLPPIKLFSDNRNNSCGVRNLGSGEECYSIEVVEFRTTGFYTIKREVSLLLGGIKTKDESDMSNNSAMLALNVMPAHDLGITIGFPQGGEQLVAGNTYDIKWSSNGIVPAVSYYIINIDSNQTNQINTTQNTSNNELFQWSIHESFAKSPGRYKIAIRGTAKDSPTREISAESRVFNIVAGSSIPAPTTNVAPTIQSITSVASTPILPANIQDGDLIRGPDGVKVYIVNAHGYKRHIFNPAIFNMYGHFKWDKIKSVDKKTLDSLKTSDFYRADGDPKVFYLKEIDEKHSLAQKRWMDIPGDRFSQLGYKWEQIFIINTKERDYYQEGTALSEQELQQGAVQ